MASNSSPRDAFWRSINTAWVRVDKRDSLLALLEAETPGQLIDAAAALTRLLPNMLSILESTLETYTSPQLWSWSVECKGAVNELLSTEANVIVSADCGFQTMMNSAWVVAMGEQVVAAAKIFCEDWQWLRGLITCEGLMRLAWRMHSRKFGTSVSQAAPRALQYMLEASRRSEDQTLLESRDRDGPLGRSGPPLIASSREPGQNGQHEIYYYPFPRPAAEHHLPNDGLNGDHRSRRPPERLARPVPKPSKSSWKLW